VHVSVTRLEQKCALAIVGVLATATLATAAPEPGSIVKGSSRNEQSPAATADWFAWAKSRQSVTSAFDVWAQHGTDPAFKLNARNTQGYPGGIDGTRLVYQQITDIDSADLRLYDLAQRRHLPLPAGVNTKRWECCATLSADWLLFTRGSPETRQLQLILLRNLVTGEQRVLDHLRNPKGVLSAGQVNGNFAVWWRCNPYPRCKIVRYDLTARTAQALPVPRGKDVYGPSVSPSGTVYYVQSRRGCGKTVQLVKQPLIGPGEVLFTMSGRDIGVTYVLMLDSKPPGRVLTTRVYFDRTVCRTGRWDIYRWDDNEPVPPP